jgi:hypothetical protein
MFDEHGETDAWVSLGTEAVPLRDDANRQADRERDERLGLISETNRRSGQAVLLCAGVALILLLLGLTAGTLDC